MKKIISLMIAAIMVMSLFAVSVSADVPPTYKTVVEDLDPEDYGEVPAGYSTYQVVVYLLNYGTINTANNNNLDGRRINNITYVLGTDNIAKIDTENMSLVNSDDSAFEFDADIVAVGSEIRMAFNAGTSTQALPKKKNKSYTYDAEDIDTELELFRINLAVEDGTEINFTPSGALGVATYSSKQPGGQEKYNNVDSAIAFDPVGGFSIGESAPATIDVTSVTISGATAATVGDDVQLSATVLPDNATDKTVTWEKVSGNGSVSSDGVVTATAAGDVVVKATAGGVASANYTVSFAAPAPTPVYTDSSIDVKTPVSGTSGLKDLQGQDVTLTANYGIAKFSTAINTVANNYFVVATDSNNKEKEFEVDFAAKGVEISNVSTTFFAIVKSADRIIKSIRLKEIAK